MAGAYSAFYSCSIGGAAMQLTASKYAEEPTVDQNAGRIGTRAVLTAEGWVEGASESALSTGVDQAITSLSLSGRDVIVTSLNGVAIIRMLAAQCLRGGPDVQFEISDSDEPGKRFVRFVANATWGVDRTRAGDTYSLKSETRADGLRVVTRTGKVLGPSASDYFSTVTLADVAAAYPVSEWVFSFKVEENRYDDTVSYEIKLEELSEPYPDAGEDATVVDGTANIRIERDEQQRKVTTTSFDLLITGDPFAVQKAARPIDGLIFRESMEYTRHKGTRLRMEFQQLASGDGGNIMDWQQSVEMDDGSQPHVGISWPGLSPQIILGDLPPRRATQSGYAIALGGFVDAPDALWIDNVEQPGKIRFDQLDAIQFRTTWSYSFVFNTNPDPQSITGRLGRPIVPA